MEVMTSSFEIETDFPDTETKEVLLSALRQYRFIAEYKAEKYSKKCETFEAKYGIDSSLFIKKFESGDIGHEDDFFDWYAAKKGLDIMTRKLKVIEGTRI